jgi:regulator of cell morphogenesis and NO signaling
MNFDCAVTIARIVAEHPSAARVFQKHGIDYCCHGDVSLAQACREADLGLDALRAELDAALAEAEPRDEEDVRALSTAALVARIVDRHHAYLRRALPYIAPIMAKVALVHGPKDAHLRELEEAFSALSAALLPHLEEEERVLFPLLVTGRHDGASLGRELSRMTADHLSVGDLLARIRRLTGGFTTPEWGCNTYRVLMAELDALEADILRHVHLENHVLAPRFAAPPPARGAADVRAIEMDEWPHAETARHG